MYYYIIFFLITTLLGFLADKIRPQKWISRSGRTQRLWVLLFILIIYVLFIGCRAYTVGADTYQYAYKYEMATSMSYTEYLIVHAFNDPFFYTIMWVMAHLSSNPTFFFVFSALFYFGILLKFITKYSNSIGWSVWVLNSMGLTTLALSSIRQGIAIAMCLLAYMCLERGRWKSILIVLLAWATHGSAIVFFPMLFVDWIKKRNIPLVLTIAVATAIVVGPVIMAYLGSSYAEATGKEVYESAAEEGVGGIGMIIFLAMLLFMGLITYFPRKNGTPFSYYSELIAIGLALAVFIISRYNQGTMRLFWYYLSFSIIYVPNVLSNMKTKMSVPWKLLLLVITFYYLTTRVMANPYNETRLLLPYSFIWD